MNLKRLRILRPPTTSGPLLYWMHRNFRAADNWALLHACGEARRNGQPVAVVVCLASSFLNATAFHFEFLLAGLQETTATLATANIPLLILRGNPGVEVARLAMHTQASLVVTDFDPLRVKRQWLGTLMQGIGFGIHEVDSRNIVPCLVASSTREYMARTLRPKIARLLPEFLDEFPSLQPHPHSWSAPMATPNWTMLRRMLSTHAGHRPHTIIIPGESAARAILDEFLLSRLSRYALRRDPNQDVTSALSTHLHFGMLAAQRVVLEVRSRGLQGTNVEDFLDELVVRRELADNFCHHTPDYDSVEGFPAWARATLHQHRHDPRPAIYTTTQLEQAATHDPLWNAAQIQMVRTGYMHGYLRMYWAKKILEWSESPSQALDTAINLNDHYSLDGRDTNGYTGIAWSIGGVHDRGWTERPVFGTVRYMNLAGARRKFDVDRFVNTWLPHRHR